jgi:hypothetical protein
MKSISRACGGKSGSYSLLSEFVDGVAVALCIPRVHHKQMARAVPGQALRDKATPQSQITVLSVRSEIKVYSDAR